MAVSRHGTGPMAPIRAVGSQIHPVFMLPPIAASWFGAILTFEFSLLTGGIHSLAIFAAVYTAHVKDGYIDYYVRSEDEDHPMTRWGCRLCLVAATVVFIICMIGLWITAGFVAVALTVPGWVIGYLHAPHLDMTTLGATFGYPTGIALAIVGGYYVQSGSIALIAIGAATVFLLVLGGVKVIDDEQDIAYDVQLGKPTVAVRFGEAGARRSAALLIATGLLLVVILVLIGVFPAGTLLAAGAFGAIATIGFSASPTIATALLIRGSYVFLGLFIAVVWWEPFT